MNDIDHQLVNQATEPDEPSMADRQIDISEAMERDAFLGDTPLEKILEGIETQFDDYINMDDTTNLVDIFYEQLAKSRDAVDSDDEEEYPQEIKDALDRIYDKFIAFMVKQFSERLTITITCVEDEDVDPDDLEFIIRRLYEFFILGAKNNFKVVIAGDINARLKGLLQQNESLYFQKVQELMIFYSPILSEIKPSEFLQIRGDIEIMELFENGQVAGNFLMKYSPKFYQNEEFQVEVINYATMCSQFGKEIADGGQ